MTIGTPGIDVSHHQDKINWAQVAAAGYRFAVIRGSYGADVKDRRFEQHWDGAKAAGLKVSSYHFLLPEQSANAQMDFWFGILGNRKPDFPLVLDVEKNSNRLPVAQMTNAVRECLSRIEARDARKAIIYTRGSFWNPQIMTSTEWAQHDLWVANYVSNPANATPTMPTAWKQWRFWQYSEHGKVPGVTGDCDLNWFNGTADDFLRYTAGSQPPTGGPAARVAVDSLNVRSAPNRISPVVGQVRKGAVVNITALSGPEIWVNVGVGQWAAFYFGGQALMELVGGLQARVKTTRLNVRSAPNPAAPAVGSLAQGKVVTIGSIEGKEVWASPGTNQWVAVTIEGTRYLTIS